ncbi:hypothetical protein LCGC14_2228460 [marine sediment metagenome]|uniref:Exonuclease domain-containing protein n=1 Tax=marine sediment metagenome TaxID=412755 RepID=A0A0F9FLG8_9ZZZZ
MEAPWVKYHFSTLEPSLTYYTYDISVLRRLIKSVRPDKVIPKNEDHRALPDVYRALMDWRFYGDLMKRGMF